MAEETELTNPYEQRNELKEMVTDLVKQVDYWSRRTKEVEVLLESQSRDWIDWVDVIAIDQDGSICAFEGDCFWQNDSWIPIDDYDGLRVQAIGLVVGGVPNGIAQIMRFRRDDGKGQRGQEGSEDWEGTQDQVEDEVQGNGAAAEEQAARVLRSSGYAASRVYAAEHNLFGLLSRLLKARGFDPTTGERVNGKRQP